MLKSHPRSLAAFGATLVLAVASILAATPQPAQAAPEQRTRTVPYGDLDLTRTEGLQRLERRVATAIEAVCAPAPSKQLSARRDYRACIAGARIEADTRVRRAELAARALRGSAIASNR